MTLDFTEKQFSIGGDGVPTFQFYRKGFQLGGGTPSYQDIILSGNTALTLANAKENGLNYLKLFGGTEQRNIPKEYTQASYLSKNYNGVTDDSVYFNTGFIPQGNEVIEIDFAITQKPSVSPKFIVLFGTRTGAVSNSNLNYWLGINYNLQLIARFGTVNVSETIDIVTDKKYHCVIDLPNCTISIDGNTYLFTDSVVSNITKSIYLFYLNGDSGLTQDGVATISNFKIKRNGTVVYTAMPTTNVGIYDTVSGTLNTTILGTSGTITAGSAITPSPETPIDIVSNNGVLKVRNKSGLPFGYQRIEYLESTGTQYIDTGIFPSNINNVKANMSFSTLGTLNYILGARLSGGLALGYILYSSAHQGITMYPGAWPEQGESNVIENKVYNINASIGSLSTLQVDGVEVVSYNTPTLQSGDNSFYIFALHGPGAEYFASARLYSMLLYKNNELVASYIPCRRNSDSVLGVYDLVSGNFLTKQGTGDFTAGDDVDDLEVYTDGTVETVEVHGVNLFDKNNALADGTIWENGGDTTTLSGYYGVSPIPVKGGHTYTRSGEHGGANYIKLNDDTWTQIQDSSETITMPDNAVMWYFNNATSTSRDTMMVIEGDTLPATYKPYYNGGTATAEMLLKVGDYKDVQSVLDGGVTRNVGIKVLDGTEDWIESSTVGRFNAQHLLNGADGRITQNTICFCTHFLGVVPSISLANMEDLTCKAGWVSGTTNNDSLYVAYAKYENNLVGFKQFLADQYAQGTPVIVVYALATATTETVTAQPLSTQAGTNIVEITQASIDNLGLEVSYKATV